MLYPVFWMSDQSVAGAGVHRHHSRLETQAQSERQREPDSLDSSFGVQGDMNKSWGVLERKGSYGQV